MSGPRAEEEAETGPFPPRGDDHALTSVSLHRLVVELGELRRHECPTSDLDSGQVRSVAPLMRRDVPTENVVVAPPRQAGVFMSVARLSLITQACWCRKVISDAARREAELTRLQLRLVSSHLLLSLTL